MSIGPPSKLGGGGEGVKAYLFGQKFGSPEEEGKKTKIIALATIHSSLS